jgi:hypothetical protein
LQESILNSTKMEKTIKPPVFIRAENLNEIARLVCAMERAPLPLFSIRNGSQNLIATQLDLFAGVPVFYYCTSNEVKRFLGYRTTQSGEEVILSDSAANSAFVHAPIIDVIKLPSIFETGMSHSIAGSGYFGPKFLSMKVKDMLALVQVASYKMMYDEPPLPIFEFPSTSPEGQTKWKLGTFTRIEEYEEGSMFFYLEQEGRINQNFVRYSVNKPEAITTNRTDEHGYLFIKIVRLDETHPLVGE